MTGRTLSYTDQVDESWAAKAIDTFEVAVEPDGAAPVVLDLSGRCPRCDDQMEDTHWLIAFSGVASLSREDAMAAVNTLLGTGIVVKPILPAEFTVQCRCKVAHPDPLHRTGLKGCGALWRMRFELADEQGPHD